MHPILAQKERIGLYLVGWLLIALLLASNAAMSGSLGWIEALALTIPMSLVYAFICLAAFYVCRSFPLGKTGFLKLVAAHAAAATLSSSLWLLIIRAWVTLLSGAEVLPGLDLKFGSLAPVLFVLGVLLFLLAGVVHYLILAFETSRDAQQQALKLGTLAREAELKALKAQIEPHFLFNSLNSISALTAADPSAARDMTVRLGEFLRKTLKLSSMPKISLAEEIALIEDFIAIEKVRFGSRLSFTRDVDEDALGFLVPPLLLQPLVENAIKHGISQTVEGGTIVLQIRRHGALLSLAVTNPYDPETMAGTSNGVGLENVAGRLASAFGNEARIDTRRTDSQFHVEMTLPVRETQAGATP